MLKSQKGFSLIEILMALMLIGILTYVSLEAINSSVSDARFQETVNEMRTITEAIVGNKKLQEGGSRTSFGYFGDVGALPATIGGLLTIPGGITNYTVSSAARTAHGWNGPYLEQGDTVADYTTDAWGNTYEWNSVANPLKLISRGSDNAVGGTGLAQDIIIDFPVNERVATVEGFVSDTGGPVAAGQADVEMNYPNGSGGLTTTLQAVTAGGNFSFASVPYGVRSITVYAPNKIASPTADVGPVVITVDKPRVFVPANQLDIDP